MHVLTLETAAAQAAAGSLTLAAPEALRTGLLAALAPEREAWLPVMAETARSRVMRLHVDGAPPLVLKRYREPGAFLLRTFLRPSRAQREAGALAMIAAAVGNVVQPVAWAEERRLGFVPRSWIVTTELTGAHDLRHLERLAPDDRALARAAAMVVLPERVAALHRAGVFARNLHAKNVLVQPATGRVAFIDLPRASAGLLTRARRVHDLACLAKGLRRGLSDDDLRALLAAYARAAGVDDDLWSDVVARVEVLDNRTPLAGAVHALRRRAKRLWRGATAAEGQSGPFPWTA
ncbi:MAG: lipopolysaccharide kinase InaA family protein [Planctomycetes bacterium]|nr:lipopolysaccharide kinase InaA family protein [Planctomycetota bacterium]